MLKPVRVSSTDHHRGKTYAAGEVIPYHLVPIGGCFTTPKGNAMQKWTGNIELAYYLNEIEPGVYLIQYHTSDGRTGEMLDQMLECTMLGDVKVLTDED